MNMKKSSLLALALAASLAGTSAMAAEDTGTMTVSAELLTACEVSPTSTISFDPVAALLSSNNQTADSGTSFQVACSADAIPKIYSGSTRELGNGTDVLPFNLSLSAGAASDDLGTDLASANALSIVQDGDFKNVTIYSRIDAADFQALSSGVYTTNITVAVVY